MSSGVWAADYTWTFDGYCTNHSIAAGGNQDISRSATTVVATNNSKDLSYVTGDNSESKIYNLSSAATVGGEDYNSYLYMGGGGSSYPSGGNLRYFTTGTITGKGKLTVVYAGTASGTCYIYNSTTASSTSSAVTTISPSASTAVTSATIDLGVGGAPLVICHGSKCYIYAIIWTEVTAVDTESPTCTTSQTTVDAYVDKATNLTVTAEHYTGLQWYKATEVGLGDAAEVAGATGATYAYTPEVADDGKTYYFYCVATNDNAAGTKTAQSSTITVNVSIPPIATQAYTANNTTCTWTNIDNAATSTNVGGNGLYFTAGSWNAITVSSGNVVLKRGNTLYVQVPAATSTGTITIISNDNQDSRVLTLNSGATLKMAKSGVTANFVASDVVNINEGYYIKLAHGDGVANFEYKISKSNSSIKVVLNGGFVTTNAGKWTSFTPASTAVYNGGAAMTSFTLPAEAQAYIVTDIDETTVTASAIDVMGAGNGYFIKGDVASTKYAVALTTDAASATMGNLLVGQLSSTTINASTPDSYTKFVLGTATSGANVGQSGLFKVTGDVTIAAGKAYLNAQKTVAANSLSFDFGETTSVVSVAKSQTTNNAEYFDLQGRRIAQPTKGLYIVNGKKVIVK